MKSALMQCHICVLRLRHSLGLSPQRVGPIIEVLWSEQDFGFVKQAAKLFGFPVHLEMCVWC